LRKSILLLTCVMFVCSLGFTSIVYVSNEVEFQEALNSKFVTSIILENSDFIGNFVISKKNDLTITSKDKVKITPKNQKEPIFKITNCSNVLINNLELTSDSSENKVVGFLIDKGKDITISNLQISNLDTVFDIKDSDYIKVIQNTFDSNNYLLRTKKSITTLRKDNGIVCFEENLYENPMQNRTNYLHLENTDLYLNDKGENHILINHLDKSSKIFINNELTTINLKKDENIHYLYDDYIYYVDKYTKYLNELDILLSESNYDISNLKNDNLIIYNENLKNEIKNYKITYQDIDKYLFLIKEYININPYTFIFSEEQGINLYPKDFLSENYPDKSVYFNFLIRLAFFMSFEEENLEFMNNLLESVYYKEQPLFLYLPSLKTDKKIMFKNNVEIYREFKNKRDSVLKELNTLKSESAYFGLSEDEIVKLHNYYSIISKVFESESKLFRILLFDTPLNLYFMRTYYELSHTEKRDMKRVEEIYLGFSDLTYIYAYGATSNITNQFQSKIIAKIKSITKTEEYEDLKTLAKTSSSHYKDMVKELFDEVGE